MNRYSLLISSFISLVLFSCGNKASNQAAAPPPVPVNVYQIKAGAANYYDLYPANVTAINSVDVRPQVAGYITGIFFKEGQFVKKGEKLYTIDQQQYLGAYDQAVANLAASQANLAKAQQDADRYTELSKEDAIAKQVLDHALADLEASKKQVQAAQANVNAVQTNLRYSTLYAPFSGTIGISQVKLGAAVSPGSTILNTISSDDPIGVDVSVDEKFIPLLIKKQNQKITRTDSSFTIVLADGTRYPFPGHIYIIDRAVDPQTGTIKVRLIFDNPQHTLRDGMTCNVAVRGAVGDSSILIPYKAVIEQMGEYFVYLVGDSSKVHQQKLSLGRHILDRVVVQSGLEPNQMIVVDGVQKLREGAAVKVGQPQADSSQAKKTDTTQRK